MVAPDAAAERRRGMFRVIIAGGRGFDNYAYLEQTMDFLLQNIEDEIIIVCGEARGADALGKRYAEERGYQIRSFPPNWEKYGFGAGPIRNEDMAKYAHALVAFWDGQSRGTRQMIETARRYRLRIKIKRYIRK